MADVETGASTSAPPASPSPSSQELKPVAMEAGKQALDGARYLFSTILTFSAIAFVCYGIGTGQAVLGGHPAMQYAILVAVLILLAYLEGLQVAILALEGIDGKRWKESHARAFKLHSLVNTGANVQRFLVGRQFYVVFVVFLCSQVTTFPSLDRPDAFPEVLWFALVQTGLPGALIVLAFGQLMPQLIASRHPVFFCNLLGSMTVLRITLILEAVGVTHFSWLLTTIVSRACRLGGKDARTPSEASTGAPSDCSTPTKDGVSECASAAGLAAGTADDDTSPEGLLKRLVRIQGAWSRAAQRDGTEKLLDTALLSHIQKESEPERAARGSLCVKAAMAAEGLKGSSVSQEGVQRMNADTPKPNVYPTPRDIVAELVASGQQVPRFLLPPDHELHVPPHIVAFSLMSGMVGAEAPK